MKKYGIVTACIIGVALSGCTSTAVSVQRSEPPVKQAHHEAGVVTSIWEEPMVDVIDVPPGLDPEGHYYRPGHQEIIEIRQGRWKYYQGQSD